MVAFNLGDVELGKHRIKTVDESGTVLAPTPQATEVNGVDPSRIGSVVAAALQDPKSKIGRRFARTEAFEDLMATPAGGDAKSRKHTIKTTTIGSAGFSQAFTGTKGELIVFGCQRRTITWRYTDGWYGWPPDDTEYRKVLRAKGYDRYSYEWFDEYVVILPPRGKLKLIASETTWVDLTGDEHRFRR